MEPSALKLSLGIEPIIQESSARRLVQRARHYREVVSHLEMARLVQVFQDKFDNQHKIRRRFGRRRPRSSRPVVLLPSAYINVSRTAISYATLLPEEEFLLVHARNSGRLEALPANVAMSSLDPYFVPADERELTSLFALWDDLRVRLTSQSAEFKTAEAVGVLARIPPLLRWGAAVRDAWNQVFESQNVSACLSADDNNPYTRIPLLLARKRGIPAIACHHGALDYTMAVKGSEADVYLAKSDMEQDYLLRVCGVPPGQIMVGAPASTPATPPDSGISVPARSWLVFFTEPYGVQGWRMEEVYRDLLPRLLALAHDCGCRLVFKLHPFEDVKGHRRLLRRFLTDAQVREIEVIAGPITDELWRNTRIALTVQSTVALDCVTRGVPVFLCSWLRTLEGGFVQQFVRFGVGQCLSSPDEIAAIPHLLAQLESRPSSRAVWKGIDPNELQSLLAGRSKPRVGAQQPA